jgi:hypothetical protein
MKLTVGSRRQVWNGTAKHTSGGLTKSDLMMSHGRIVSKKKHFTAKKEMRLVKHGYGTKKGKFGYVKVGTKKRRRGMRGGSLSPAGVNDSYMIKDVVPQTFSPLDRALVGGRGRSRSRGMAGGSGMKAMSESGSANWNGDGISGSGITDFGLDSNDVQIQAGMSGGRHRGRRHRRGRGRSRRMAGGTTSIRSQLMPEELNSTNVQMRAGLGN